MEVLCGEIELICKDLGLTVDAKFDSYESQFIKTFDKLVNACSVKPLKKVEDVPYMEGDFVGIAMKGCQFLTYLQKILHRLFLESQNKIICNDETIRTVILESLFISLQYQNSESLWSSESCAKLYENIVYVLMLLAKCETQSEFLFGEDYSESSSCKGSVKRHSGNLFPSGIFKSLVLKNSECFEQKSWKQKPYFVDSYFWMLYKIKGPKLMYDYIQYFLPPALFLLDDWELRHKIYGSKAVTYILSETGYSDLRLFGRAEVVFDALKHQLYSKEADVLAAVYPAILKSAVIIEKDPRCIGSIKKNYFDIIMEHLLREMTYEQKLALRSIYIVNLHQLIAAMKISSVRWTDEILDVCSTYLETFEGSFACDRLMTIQIIKQFICYCWPRSHDHLLDIMKMICKFIYTTSKDDSGIDSEALMTINKETKELMNLMYAAAPLKYTEICSDMTNLNSGSKQFAAILSILEDVMVKS